MAPRCQNGLKIILSLDAVIDRFGADAVRLYLLNSPAVYGRRFAICRKGSGACFAPGFDPALECLYLFVTYAQNLQLEASAKHFAGCQKPTSIAGSCRVCKT